MRYWEAIGDDKLETEEIVGDNGFRVNKTLF